MAENKRRHGRYLGRCGLVELPGTPPDDFTAATINKGFWPRGRSKVKELVSVTIYPERNTWSFAFEYEPSDGHNSNNNSSDMQGAAHRFVTKTLKIPAADPSKAYEVKPGEWDTKANVILTGPGGAGKPVFVDMGFVEGCETCSDHAAGKLEYDEIDSDEEWIEPLALAESVTDAPTFPELYNAQVANQVTHFGGVDPKDLHLVNPHEHIQFVHWNHIALTAELTELIDEFSWKPWSVDYAQSTPDAKRVAGEVADVLCFLSNIARAAGLEGEDILTAWDEKIARNRARQEAGYDVSADGWKCRECGAALDDEGVLCTEMQCAKGAV